MTEAAARERTGHSVRTPTPSAAALNPEVAPELDAVIQRLTAKAPEERFASAAETLEAIGRLGRTESVPEPVSSTPEHSTAARTSTLRRRVPNAIFFTVVLGVGAVAAIPCVVIWNNIDARPTVALSPEQLAEFAQKREALRVADQLFRDGKYQESLEAYEAYLARYPYSTVARGGAERARIALESQTIPSQAATRSRQQPQTRMLMQDIKRSVKRLFRND